MTRYLGLSVSLFAALTVSVLGLWYYTAESGCRRSNRCVDRLQAIHLQLEQYSVDKAVAWSKKHGGVLPRRSFYPKDLEALVPGDYLSEANAHCPALGCRYAYRLLGTGQSYLLYCPGPHTMHFAGDEFKPAVMPDDIDLKLAVQGGKVVDLCGPLPIRTQAPAQASAEGGALRHEFQDMRKRGGHHDSPWLPGGTGFLPNEVFLEPSMLAPSGR